MIKVPFSTIKNIDKMFSVHSYRIVYAIPYAFVFIRVIITFTVLFFRPVGY